MLADRIVKGENLLLGGRKWHLLATYRVLLDCEEETGIDMLSSVQAVTEPSTKAFRALLWAMMRRHEPLLSQQEVGSMLSPRNLPEARRAVVRAFVASMPPPEKRRKPSEDEEEAPKKHPMTWVDTQAAAWMELHLSDEQWMGLTPRQFQAFRRKVIEQQRREEMLVGQICATFVNYSGRVKQWKRPQDFLTHKFPIDEEEEQQPQQLTGEMIMKQVSKMKQRRR